MTFPAHHSPRITTLYDISKKYDDIHLSLQISIQGCLRCYDFVQVQAAVLEHFKQAIQCINHCITSILIHQPQLNLQLLDVYALMEMNTSTYRLNDLYTIDQVDIQLRELSTAIDQWVLMIRDCPDIETKPHIRLLAQAMCEIFEIQNFYIYPYYPTLIPEYLKKSNFNRHLDEPIK